MRVEINARLTFMANPERRLIVVRPIGELSARSFIDQLFDHYATVAEPWTYNRLTDFRRFSGFLSDQNLTEIAERWRTLADGHSYHSHVAVVSFDALDRLRVPAVSPMFPNETICLFSDYHEAMGWLTAMDRARYLAELGPSLASRESDDSLQID
jgi:hypothetical protein